MALRAVFFDWGGTLGSLDPTVDEPWKAWSQVARDLGIKIADSRLRRVNEDADRQFEGRIYDHHGRTSDFWKMRDMWAIDQLGITRRREEFFEALQAIYGDPRLVHLYPETMEVLEETRALGTHMGVISNFTDALLSILKHQRIDTFFDSVTYSQAVGAQKPDASVFLQALKRAGCRPAEAVHVGDSWEGDYLGASRVGIMAVWLNRGDRPAPRACPEIRDLRGLRGLLTTHR